MPIATAMAGPVSKWPGTNGKIKKECASSIIQLTFADLWRAPGTLVIGPPRLDAQGPWSAGPGFNIQVQAGKVSLGAIRIASTLAAAAAGPNQALVLAAAQAALNASCADGIWRNVTGTSP